MAPYLFVFSRIGSDTRISHWPNPRRQRQPITLRWRQQQRSIRPSSLVRSPINMWRFFFGTEAPSFVRAPSQLSSYLCFIKITRLFRSMAWGSGSFDDRLSPFRIITLSAQIPLSHEAASSGQRPASSLVSCRNHYRAPSHSPRDHLHRLINYHQTNNYPSLSKESLRRRI